MEITAIQPLIRGKKPWARLVNPDVPPREIIDADFYDIPQDSFGGLAYQFLGNAELLTECTEGARPINSNLYSTRPIYEIVEKEVQVIGEGGVIETKKVKEEVIVDFDRIENVRSGLSGMIPQQKASHLAQNGIMIADESGKDPEAFDILRSYKDSAGLDSAWLDAINHAGRCGDAAIYPYIQGNHIRYAIFAYDLGDMLFPQKDDRGHDMMVRLYKLRGRDAVDIFMTDWIETWVRGDLMEGSHPESRAVGATEPSAQKTWWDKIKGWFRKSDLKQSTDGWTRVSRSQAQLDSETPQFIYIRFADSFIGPAMQNLEAFDRGLSYVSDKMRSTAFSKLLVKATKIKNLPPLSSGEEVIGIDGDVESLKAADVRHVVPPDMSNIATINLKNIHDAIMESTMSIDLPPEILKSGADSSLTLKILFRREEQWCHNAWPQVRPAAAHAMEILKGLVGKLEGDIERYGRLRNSVWCNPWMPQDEDALAQRVQNLSYASIISQKASRDELGLQYTNDAEQIRKEQEEKIFRETYFKFMAEAKAREEFPILNQSTENSAETSESDSAPKPDSGKVDNQAPNK